MTTAAKGAFGTTLTWNSQTVAELTNIGGVEISVDMIDVTSHQSTSGLREFIAGLADPGEVPIEGNFKYDDTNGQIAMVTDAVAKTSRAVVITFPDSLGVWSFTAYISKIKVGDNAIDGKIPFSASLKITGVPTLTVTASNNLSGLTVSGVGTVLVPTFAATTYAYVVNIATGVSSVTITPTAAAGVITITANGASQVVASGNPSSAITLGAAGSVTTATVVVQESGKTAKTYTLYLARAAS